MRLALFSLAICLAGLTAQAQAQCPAPVYSGGYPVYSGYAPYMTYYAPYASYAPYRARMPSYPALSSSPTGGGYGMQTTYFRGQPGPFAPPGGTFFGGYDYQITYPPGWYGGYWGGW
jgi:hypothetical protein